MPDSTISPLASKLSVETRMRAAILGQPLLCRGCVFMTPELYRGPSVPWCTRFENESGTPGYEEWHHFYLCLDYVPREGPPLEPT